MTEKAKTEEKTDALLQRINRAVEGLERGKYSVHRLKRGEWRVDNEHASYFVTHDGEGWHCNCPDHQERGMTCKHIFMTYLTEQQQRKGVPLRRAAEDLKQRLSGNGSKPKPETQEAPEHSQPTQGDVLHEILLELRYIREALVIIASEADNNGAGLQRLIRDAILDADMLKRGEAVPSHRPRKVSLDAGARL